MSSLFVEAEVWEDVALFFELQTSALQRDHNSDVRTGEVHVHFRDVLKRWGAGRDLYEAIGVDLMLLVDTRGRLLTDASHAEYADDDMSGMAGVLQGLQGVEYEGFWSYRRI